LRWKLWQRYKSRSLITDMNIRKVNDNITIIYKEDRDHFINDFNEFLDMNDKGFLLVLSPEDTFGKERQGETYENDMAEALFDILEKNESAVLATPKRLFQFPDRITGVMFRLDMIDIRLDNSLYYNYEADFMIRLISEHPYLIQQKIRYKQGEAGDGNYYQFGGIYDKRWYLNDMKDYLIPLVKRYDRVPDVIQIYAMYNITCRLDANHNNNNRHVLSEEEIDLFMDYIGEVLQHIDDRLIMSAARFPIYRRDFQFTRMLLRIKKQYADSSDEGLKLIKIDSPEMMESEIEDRDFFQLRNVTYPLLMLEGTDNDGNAFPAHTTSNLRCNIQYMDIRDGVLEIDGSVPDIYDKDKVSYYFDINGKRYPVDFCERYSLNKYFGRSAYKRFPFHASIPLGGEISEGEMHFCVSPKEDDKCSIVIAYEFKSHTSRLAYYPRNTYWHKANYLFTTVRETRTTGDFVVTGIKISPYSWMKMASREIGIGYELLKSCKMHRFRFFLLRAAWVATHPYFGRKKIWLFFDKIYKGGDSSEYMYKYTCDMIEKAKKDSTVEAPDKAYYLLDKTAADYKRLISEGYKPLKRGSFLHRLVFLNADIVVASNSTVFAFNDYYMENSRYIRGIPDFDVACVQHGLSVQKIALAQQRLRDNIKYYFIASNVEKENLLHPVYDYAGYDIIKLTGIPRYDGLKNDDRKQIIISPTWRMQSARFVTRNEGVERDYNPDFKDTEYYKVYNGLINNKKLIAAAEKYGYRIKYVLHPIVSPQAEDFDANEYVDIIPATGDMSYEKLFCQSSLMVTDYSGIQFDFAYMRKPLVYYHPESLEAHYEEGSFHYDTMAFGEIVRDSNELVELLTDYMKNGCVMKEIYRRRADDFFEYNDRNNSKRVYEELIKKYQ